MAEYGLFLHRKVLDTSQKWTFWKRRRFLAFAESFNAKSFWSTLWVIWFWSDFWTLLTDFEYCNINSFRTYFRIFLLNTKTQEQRLLFRSSLFLSGAVLVDQNYFKSIPFLRVLRAAWIELLIEKTIFLNDSKSRILLLYWEGTLSEYLITISVSLPDRVSRVKVTFQSRWMATNAKIETGDPALAIVGMIKVASRNSIREILQTVKT